MLLSRVIYFKALKYIHTQINIQIHTHTPLCKSLQGWHSDIISAFQMSKLRLGLTNLPKIIQLYYSYNKFFALRSKVVFFSATLSFKMQKENQYSNNWFTISHSMRSTPNQFLILFICCKQHEHNLIIWQQSHITLTKH